MHLSISLVATLSSGICFFVHSLSEGAQPTPVSHDDIGPAVPQTGEQFRAPRNARLLQPNEASLANLTAALLQASTLAPPAKARPTAVFKSKPTTTTTRTSTTSSPSTTAAPTSPRPPRRTTLSTTRPLTTARSTGAGGVRARNKNMSMQESENIASKQLRTVKLFFSHVPASQPGAVIVPLKSSRVVGEVPETRTSGIVRVKMFANEPCVIGLRSDDDDDVFTETATEISELTGGTARHSWSLVIPRGGVGLTHNFTLFVSNRARSVITPILVVAELVQTSDSRLQTVHLSPGRLEPSFQSDVFAYHMRIPETSKSFNVDFRTASAQDASCSLDGERYFNGSGKVRINIPDDAAAANDSYAVQISCKSSDGKSFTRYIFNIVPQKGGDTILNRIGVMGGPLSTQFEPDDHGPYRADLVRGSKQDGGQELQWTQLKLEALNPRATVTVDGYRVDSDGFSHWIRVPRGGSHKAQIRVSTPENPVAEEYEVLLSRQKPMGATEAVLMREGRHTSALALASGLAGPQALLQSVRVSQMFSVLGRKQESPEIYEDFAQGSHPYNLQPQWRHVHLTSRNRSAGDLSKLDVSSRDRFVVPEHMALPTANFISQFFFRPRKEAFHNQRGAEDRAVHYVKQSGEENRFRSEGPGEEEEQSAFRREGPGEDEEGQQEQSAFRREGEEEGSGYFWSSRRRQLIPLNPKVRSEINQKLEGLRKTHEAFLGYTNCLILVALMNTAAGLLFFVLYSLTMREHNPLVQLEGGSSVVAPDSARTEKGSPVSSGAAPVPISYPKALHPCRFFTFFLDVAFVSTAASSVGLLTSNLEAFDAVNLWGVEVGVGTVKLCAAVAYALCVMFVLGGGLLLMSIGGSMTFSAQFCEYHDSRLVHGKGIYVPPWAQRLPWLRDLFTTEITAVTPLRSVNSNDVIYFGRGAREDRVSAVMAQTEGGYSSLAEDYASSTEPEYSGRRRAIEVAMNDIVYNGQLTNYDNRNAGVQKAFPKATIGRINFVVPNAHGYAINLEAELQVEHLTAIMQLVDTFHFWLPRENCDFPAADGWRGLLAHAGKGLFYDWVINRGLVLTMLSLAAYFDGLGSALPLLLVAGFSLAAGLIRLPAHVELGFAKFARHQQTRQEEARERAAAALQLRDAEAAIWPFCEPGMGERFAHLRDKKEAQAGACCRGKESLAGSAWSLEDSAAWFALKEVVCTVVLSDLLLALVALCLYLDRVQRTEAADAAGTAAIVLCVATLVLLNVRPAVVVGRLLKTGAEAALEGLIYAGVHVSDLVYGPMSMGESLGYFLRQLGKRLAGDPTANFHPPKADVSVRRFPVQRVQIVSNELGLMLPCRVRRSMKHLEFSVPDQKRLRLYKTLVVNGGIGASRGELFTSLPIQVPFYQLFKDDGAPKLNSDTPIERLVATIQVVNHTYRANAAGLATLDSSEHDSFLSLFANDEFFPPPGKLKLRRSGHVFSVRYDADLNQLVVRGPGLLANRRYTLKTARNQPDTRDMYMNAQPPFDLVSTDSEPVAPASAKGAAEALCETPGSLRVEVPNSLPPDLYKPIQLRCPSGATHTLDPISVKVHYDPDCDEMFLRHQELQINAMNYRVEWAVAPAKRAPVDAAGTSVENGLIVFELNKGSTDRGGGGGECPDLTSWMTLRDEKGAVVDIDPRQTDAYQFFFPERAASFMENLSGRLQALSSFCRGEESGAGFMEEPIPCTIVQCVNPVERIFRVDPNFHEGYRVLNARIHEFRGRQTACENPEALPVLWQTLMRPQEYIDFWREFGVGVVDANGSLRDPLQVDEEANQMFQDSMKEIAHGENELRRELSRRLDLRIQDAQLQIDKLRVWIRAYNDPTLQRTQLEKDQAEWAMQEDGRAETYGEQLVALKTQYEAFADNFVYPCNVPDVLISKRPNLSAQFRLWSDIVQSWLLFEEGTLISTAEGKHRVAAIVRDIMQSLKYALHSNEVRSLNSYRSVLHYVVGSHSLRGLATAWRPDTFRAHPALVRIWPERDDKREADFDKYPEWLPCLLRLTPTALQMLLPNGDDLVRAAPEGDYPWQRSTGLYVPLYAFQKFELAHDTTVPPSEDNNALLKTMTTRLVCRKNQFCFVDDGYARRMEDDQIGNEICFTDASGQRRMKYRMMVGHCVPAEEANKYSMAEADRSLRFPEVNVHPLSFRISPTYDAQWERAIQMADLHRPHNYDFDGSIPTEQEPPPPPPAPAAVFSSSSSSSSVSSVSQELPPAPAPPPPEEPPLIIKSQPSIVSSSSSEPLSVLSSNPEGVVVFRGDLSRGRCEGDCVFRDEAGRAIFEGPMADGRRSGKGTASFADHNKTQWQYEGEFVTDEMQGVAVVKIADATQVANVPERLTVISFTGDVAPVQSKAAMDSLPQTLVDELLLNRRHPPSFAASRSRFSKDLAAKVETLVNSCYVRHRDEKQEVFVDRFCMAEILANPDFAAELRGCTGHAQAQFMSQLAPQVCRWSDSTFFERVRTGEWRFADGSVFQGHVVKGRPSGLGSFYHEPSGVRFEGNFEDGRPEGPGVLEVGSDDALSVYYGEFKNGQRHGEGIQELCAKNVVIQGRWENNRLADGHTSIVVAPDFAKQEELGFTVYTGQLTNGVPEGFGRIEYAPSGLVYEGHFLEGQKHGEGMILRPDGEILADGEFKQDLPDGRFRRYEVGDGGVYRGDLSKGLRSGAGVVMSAQKVMTYDGIWLNDVPHGRGNYVGPDGEYEGEWKNGKRHGKGKFVYKEKPLANGKHRVYEGDWSNDMPQGIGKYLADDGSENVYRLEKGEVVSASLKSYKPMCAKGPNIQVKPSTALAGFKPVVDPPWAKNKVLFSRAQLQSICERPTSSDYEGSWKAYEACNTLIDPTREIPMQKVRNSEPPKLPVSPPPVL